MKTEAELWPLIAGMEMREADWDDPPEINDADHHPCLPYPPKWFAVLADAAVKAVPDGVPRRFLEVGCGIGTKAAFVRDAYGFEVFGFDRVPEYVTQAEKFGVTAVLDDAEAFAGYEDFGIVYVNHPFKDFETEGVLERRIHDEMMPGAVLICVNTLHHPRSWEPVIEPPRRGDAVWRKPV